MRLYLFFCCLPFTGSDPLDYNACLSNLIDSFALVFGLHLRRLLLLLVWGLAKSHFSTCWTATNASVAIHGIGYECGMSLRWRCYERKPELVLNWESQVIDTIFIMVRIVPLKIIIVNQRYTQRQRLISLHLIVDCVNTWWKLSQNMAHKAAQCNITLFSFCRTSKMIRHQLVEPHLISSSS